MHRDFNNDFHTPSALGSDDVLFDNFPASYEVIGKLSPVEAPQPEALVPAPKPIVKKLVLDPNKKYEFKSPSIADQNKAFKQIFFDLHFQRYVTMNEQAVFDLLGRIDGYVGYHSTANGERSEEEVQQNINHGFWKFIMNDEEKGIREIIEKSVVVKAVKAPRKNAKKQVRKPRVKKDVLPSDPAV